MYHEQDGEPKAGPVIAMATVAKIAGACTGLRAAEEARTIADAADDCVKRIVSHIDFLEASSAGRESTKSRDRDGEQAGRVTLAKASKARVYDAALADYLKCAKRVIDDIKHGHLCDAPLFALALSAQVFCIICREYGDEANTRLSERPKKENRSAKAPRGDATIVPVRLKDLSVTDQALVLSVADADESELPAAVAALREQAAKTGKSSLLEMCAQIDAGNSRYKLNRLVTQIRRQYAGNDVPPPTASPTDSDPIGIPMTPTAPTLSPTPQPVLAPTFLAATIPITLLESAVTIVGAADPDNSLHRDGTDEDAVPNFLTWLETMKPGFANLFDTLVDGTVVRAAPMKYSGPNARFDRAGRHPQVQAKLREMIAQLKQSTD
jgi:hypothetical protein